MLKINFKNNYGLAPIWLIVITTLITAAVVTVITVCLISYGISQKLKVFTIPVSPGVNINQPVDINQNLNVNVPIEPTTGWKTYNNDIYGFSIKYPVDWYSKDYYGDNPLYRERLQEFDVKIGFAPTIGELKTLEGEGPAVPIVLLVVPEKKGKQGVTRYEPSEYESLKDTTCEKELGCINKQEEIVTMGGISAQKIRREYDETVFYKKGIKIFIERDKKLYALTIVDEEHNPYENILDLMAYSFEFTR